MKPVGLLVAIVGCVFLALSGGMGCRRSDGPRSEAAAGKAEAATTAPANGVPAPAAKDKIEDADFPGPPADAMPDQPQPANDKSAGPQVAETAEAAEAPKSPPVLPLVDNFGELQRLDPKLPVWFDKSHRQVVLVGEVCQNRVPLELFACQRGTKEHESVISIDTKAYLVHAGLIAAGADPGNPVQFQPKFVPARGPEIEVTVVWKDQEGKRHQVRGQDWVRHMRTHKAMEYPWVFAGSRFSTDPQTGQQHYHADWEGDLICVSNFPDAVLDVPVASSDSNDALLFEAFTDRIPPVGTPVTLLLKPKLDGKQKVKEPVRAPESPDGPAS